MFFLRAEGFSCSLDFLYGDQISKLQFLTKKANKDFQLHIFCSSIFGHQNPGSGLDLDPDSLECWIRIRMLHPDPYPDLVSMNPELQHWMKNCVISLIFQTKLIEW